MSGRRHRLRYVRLEGARARLADGTIHRHLIVAFRWQGPADPKPRRYRHFAGLLDTRESRNLWASKIANIERELITGTFDLARWFPGSRKVARAVTYGDTVGSFARAWLEELTGTGVGAHTVEQYRLIFEAHILNGPIAGLRLAELDAGHIQQWRGRLMRKDSGRGGNLRVSTVNKIAARLRTMLNVAFQREAIPRASGNPMLQVRNLRQPQRRVAPFTPDELLKIFAVCEGQQRAIYITLAFTALRPSDLLGLYWEHIDFAEDLILVRQQLRDDGTVDSELKTERSLRDVTMLKPVRAALAALQAQNRLRSKFVFCNRRGLPLTEN